MPIKVVFYTDSANVGGAEKVLSHILVHLDEQRWHARLLHHGDRGISSLLAEVRELSIESTKVPRVERLWEIHRLWRLVKVLRAERPVIFHANVTWPLSCKYGLIAARLAGVPIVVATAHLHFQFSGAVHAQERIIAKCVSRYLAVSSFVARRLNEVARIPARKIEVVHNGIDISEFLRPGSTVLRDSLVGKTKRSVVLVTARLEKQKGLECLMEAALLVPDAVFVVVGQGTQRPALEFQVRQLKAEDRVVFLGPREDIADLLRSADLFVLPSLYEGFPLAILEAMAAGKPVVASRVGGVEEAVLHGKTGLLVRPKDPASLAAAMRAVLGNREFARTLGESGRSRAINEFTAQRMVTQITNIYEELVAARSTDSTRI